MENLELSKAYQKAIAKGLMTRAQYDFIAETIAPGHSMLVFGCGHDSDLWTSLTKGRIAFVEHNKEWLTSGNLFFGYNSRRDVWCDVPPVPFLLNRDWDIIFVDGPPGHTAIDVGRQFSVAWASQLKCQNLFVHDYERPWERLLCDSYLGAPNKALGNLVLFSRQNSSADSRE
jgi:hypothetical protein